MKSINRVLVLIDGANFYRNLKSLNLASMHFKFRPFVEKLAEARNLVGIQYYIGQLRKKAGDPKSIELYRHQQIFFQKLEKANIKIIRGKVQQYGTLFIEKGVDVKMAIDLIEGAYENSYDTAIIISSDSDLTPAIVMAKSKNKTIEVIGFPHKICYDLKKHASFYRSVSRAFLHNFNVK